MCPFACLSRRIKQIFLYASSLVQIHGVSQFFVPQLISRQKSGQLTASEMETGRVDRPVWSRFFDRLVKPDKKPVKFSFLVTKIHLNATGNIHTDMSFLNSL